MDVRQKKGPGAGRPDLLWTLLAGLLAGVVMVAGELVVNVWMLGEVWAEVMASMGLGPRLPAVVVAGMGAALLLLGVVGVWLYAGLVPMYGRGPDTALRVSVALWAVLYAFPVALLLGMEGVGGSFVLGFSMWGLAELVMALGAGSWLYHEETRKAADTGSAHPTPA